MNDLDNPEEEMGTEGFSLLAFLGLLAFAKWRDGGFTHEQWPERRKFFRTIGYIFAGWCLIAGVLILIGISGVAKAEERRTYKNSNGQTIGRSSTDARGTTTFYNPLGQQTGRSSTSNGTTTFRDNMGRQTGSSRK